MRTVFRSRVWRAMAVLLAAVGLAQAARAATVSVDAPFLAAEQLSGDSGLSAVGGDLTLVATVTTLNITGADAVPAPFGPVPIMVTAQYDQTIGSNYVFDNVLVSVDGGAMLTASGSYLVLEDLSPGAGVVEATLTYTGGSLQGSLTGGKIYFAFEGASGSYAGTFGTSGIGAVRLGAVSVVPLPAALPLFGTALAGLGLLRRRRRAPRVRSVS